MFDIGFFELLLIFVVILLVFGPEKLPSIAKTAGLYIAKIRNFATKVQDDINQQLQLEELKQELEKKNLQLQAQSDELKKSLEVDLPKFDKSIFQNSENTENTESNDGKKNSKNTQKAPVGFSSQSLNKKSKEKEEQAPVRKTANAKSFTDVEK